MKLKTLVIFCLCGVLSVVASDVFAAMSRDERANIIERELDCLSRNMDQKDFVDWGNVCYVDEDDQDGSDSMADALTSVNNFEVAPIVVTSEPVENTYKKSDDAYDSEYIYEDTDTIAPQNTIYKQPKIYKSEAVRKDPSNKEFWTYDNLFARENPLTKIEIGSELYHVTYEEPGLMKDQGVMYGFNAAYTYRTQTNDHIESLKDIFTDSSKINMFRVEFDMSRGDLDYKSEGTGSDENIKNSTYEVRGLLGYDIPVYKTTQITPYTGVGYRYHTDDSGGSYTTTGDMGYERENRCYYMPLGIETTTNINHKWEFALNLEYDLFVGGQQISHLEDTDMFYGSDGKLHSSDALKHEQYDGYGLRANFKISKLNESFDVFLKPYVNYWEKSDSDLTQLTSEGGTTYWYWDSAYTIPVWYYEPENRTWEYGVKMGIMF